MKLSKAPEGVATVRETPTEPAWGKTEEESKDARRSQSESQIGDCELQTQGHLPVADRWMGDGWPGREKIGQRHEKEPAGRCSFRPPIREFDRHRYCAKPTIKKKKKEAISETLRGLDQV